VPPPSRLRRFAHDATAFFGTDVTPTRRAEADSGSLDRLGRELSTGEIEHFDRQVEQDFWRKASVTHEASQARRAPRAQHPREFGRQVRTGR
jgi:hypothetical protein